MVKRANHNWEIFNTKVVLLTYKNLDNLCGNTLPQSSQEWTGQQTHLQVRPFNPQQKQNCNNPSTKKQKVDHYMCY